MKRKRRDSDINWNETYCDDLIEDHNAISDRQSKVNHDGTMTDGCVSGDNPHCYYKRTRRGKRSGKIVKSKKEKRENFRQNYRRNFLSYVTSRRRAECIPHSSKLVDEYVTVGRLLEDKLVAKLSKATTMCSLNLHTQEESENFFREMSLHDKLKSSFPKSNPEFQKSDLFQRRFADESMSQSYSHNHSYQSQSTNSWNEFSSLEVDSAYYQNRFNRNLLTSVSHVRIPGDSSFVIILFVGQSRRRQLSI
jgi:hypothetical protein